MDLMYTPQLRSLALLCKKQITGRSLTMVARLVPHRFEAATIWLIVAMLVGCSRADDPSSERSNAEAIAAAPLHAASAASPVVVELYQSQSCSSCPSANANLNAIADRPDVLALSFAVTYWDKLGWKDSFARPEHTERQWNYARAAGRENVETPQVIINGRHRTIIGNNRRELDETIKAAGPPSGGPTIRSDGHGVVLSAGKGGLATVWLVGYDPKVREVAIRAGENGGRTLPHRGIVHELVRLGDWRGAAVRFELPPAQLPDLNSAVLVQQGQGGPITAARRI